MKKIIFIYLCFLPLTIFSGEIASRGGIIIKMAEFRNDKGDVRIAVYKSKDGFPDKFDKAFKTQIIKIKNQKAETAIADIPYGAYAAAILHDENSSGDMDSNWLGIPKEGYGASNNIVNKFGPPKFSDSKFILESKEIVINIKVQY
ncbi:DUF2141 domain-containing protein [Candidatus Desantisbacteria bacterium]|nr:DUF2141 domain-containing protein [Candidatus Desantisbacteria bacterium]